MYKFALVFILGVLLFGGDPSIAELIRKYVEVQAEIADMRRAVCPG